MKSLITPEFDRFAAPARAYLTWRRVAAGIALAVLTYFLVFVAVWWVFAILIHPPIPGAGPDNASQMEAYLDLWNARFSPTYDAMRLAIFLGMLLGALVLAAAHRRGLTSLLGIRAGFWRYMAAAGILSVLIYAPFMAFDLVAVQALDPAAANLSKWLVSLLWVVPLIFLQTTSEELLFRGYLLQLCAAISRNPVIWIGVPSLAFALIHMPANLAHVATALGFPFVFGLVALDLTRVTGSLGAAIALHFVNNAYAFLGISGPTFYGGLAYYHVHDGGTLLGQSPVLAIFKLLVFWAVMRFWLRRDRG